MSSPQEYVCEEREEREINRIQYELTVLVDVATDQQCDDRPDASRRLIGRNGSKFLINHGSSVIAPPIKRAIPNRSIPNQDFMTKNISVALPQCSKCKH